MNLIKLKNSTLIISLKNYRDKFLDRYQNIDKKEIAVTGAERQMIFNINVQAKTSRNWIYYSYGIPIFLTGLIIFFLSRRKRRQKTN